jgi:hypothetical protein
MKKQSRLLIAESPTVFQKTLAVTVGLNAAIFLQQLEFWLSIAEQEHAAEQYWEGRWWVRNTYRAWAARHFPFWSVGTLKRIAAYLENELRVVLSRPDPDRNDGKWYTIDYDALDRLDVLPPDIGFRMVEAEARSAPVPDATEPILEPDPEPEERPLAPAGSARHVRGHTQYRAVRRRPKSGTQSGRGSDQKAPTGRLKMRRPVDSKCDDPSTQNATTRAGRLNVLKSQMKSQIKNQTGSARAFESAGASPPIAPPAASALSWAEPGRRERVLRDRDTFRRRLEEREWTQPNPRPSAAAPTAAKYIPPSAPSTA